MSTYTSQEEKIILKDNDEINSIDLENNLNLKVLIIDNLSNLEKIEIPITEGLYVSISNCEKLKKIFTYCDYYDVYGSYFYLGENLKYLEIISLQYFNTVKIVDQVFDKLKDLSMDYIKSLICDFKNFPKLYFLRLYHVEYENLIVDSERICLFSLLWCSFENIEITGKGNIKFFEFNNNNYKSLKVEQSIKTINITLYNADNRMIPYIPLSDEIDKILNFCIGVDNVYDYQYKSFIERNLSKINLIDYSSEEEISLDDMKFNVPQKKRAR